MKKIRKETLTVLSAVLVLVLSLAFNARSVQAKTVSIDLNDDVLAIVQGRKAPAVKALSTGSTTLNMTFARDLSPVGVFSFKASKAGNYTFTVKGLKTIGKRKDADSLDGRFYFTKSRYGSSWLEGKTKGGKTTEFNVCSKAYLKSRDYKKYKKVFCVPDIKRCRLLTITSHPVARL